MEGGLPERQLRKKKVAETLVGSAKPFCAKKDSALLRCQNATYVRSWHFSVAVIASPPEVR